MQTSLNIEVRHIKLSELVFKIDNVISDAFQDEIYWVIAETSDIRNYYDRGYCFLTLIEKENNDVIAKMDAVIWRQYYDIIENFENITGRAFEKNLEVLLKVRVAFSPKYGRLNLEILRIDYNYTLGKIELERQEILSRLVKENPAIISLIDREYHTYNKSLQLPAIIQDISLISAPNSDGLTDFLHELNANKYGFKFNIDEYLTQIQGKNADQLIINQLELIKKSGKKYDVTVIVRGGGSQIDFSSFDTYEIGKKIAGFHIPVIAGIGHERNISITDLMCNLSVKTPTKVAAYILDVNQHFDELIDKLKEQLIECIENILDSEKECLTELIDNFKRNTEWYLKNMENELEKHIIAIKHLDPKSVLARGYAVVLHNDQLVTNPNKIEPGNIIKTLMKDILLTSKVIQKQKKNEDQLDI
ncbi:MAG: exodeoxyribonuclease VII large subunit [Bacteroidota bacterium]